MKNIKNLFYLLSFILISITLSTAIIAAENPAGKIEDFTQTQIKKIEKIAHNYIVNNPQILVEAGKKLQQLETLKEKMQIEQIKTNLPKYKNQIFDTKAPGRVVLGNPKGKIIIAEFTQYQCASCKLAAPIMSNLIKTNPEIQLIIIYWPFLGNDAIYTAKAVLAAQNQNRFAELDNAILAQESFVNKDTTDTIIKSIPTIDSKKLYAAMNSKNTEDSLKANLKLAQDLAIVGTPTFIFTNREMTKFSLVPGKSSAFENDLAKALSEVN